MGMHASLQYFPKFKEFDIFLDFLPSDPDFTLISNIYALISIEIYLYMLFHIFLQNLWHLFHVQSYDQVSVDLGLQIFY